MTLNGNNPMEPPNQIQSFSCPSKMYAVRHYIGGRQYTSDFEFRAFVYASLLFI